jgi:hypothetical protein
VEKMVEKNLEQDATKKDKIEENLIKDTLEDVRFSNINYYQQQLCRHFSYAFGNSNNTLKEKDAIH